MPHGNVPTGMPNILGIGLQEHVQHTWMRSTGTPWSFRTRYFVKGHWNNWGNDPTPDASWARAYMDSCGQFIPALQYYCIRSEPPVGEGNVYVKAQNIPTMRQYFLEFRDTMRRAKDYNKPVLFLMEADGFAELATQSGQRPNAPAAVASTGHPELAGLPNTLTGWMRAFGAIRAHVGASKAVLGIHISTWATGVDLMHGSGMNAPLSPEVDKAYAFVRDALPAYDLLVGDPLDRDAAFYVNQPDRFWGPAQFDRYEQWLTLWNAKAQKRWVLWQIPCGNSRQLNAYNSGQPHGGWKDNRSEVWLGPDAARRRALVDAGVIGLIFSQGANGQSSHLTDQDANGQLYIAARARAYYQSPLPVGGSPVPQPPQPAVLSITARPQQGPLTGRTAKVTITITNTGGPWSGRLVIGSQATNVSSMTGTMNLERDVEVGIGATSLAIAAFNEQNTLIKEHHLTINTQLHVL